MREAGVEEFEVRDAGVEESEVREVEAPVTEERHYPRVTEKKNKKKKARVSEVAAWDAFMSESQPSSAVVRAAE